MADTPQAAPQESQAPLFDMSKATPISQPADKPLFDMSKATPIAQPMVTNLSGQQLPADVAARHARANSQIPPDEQARRAGFAPETGESGLTGLAVGVGKAGLKTAQGAVKLVNMALPHSSGFGDLQIPVPAEGEDTTPHGVAENLGDMGENITEFAAGDEVLKGMMKSVDVLAKMPQAMRTVLEAHPKTFKAISNILKNTAVGGAQGATKGAADDRALEGAEAGAAGGAIGSTIAEAGGAVVPALAKKVGLLTDDTEDIMRAAKPGKRNTRFLEDWDIAKDRYAKELDANGKYEDLNDAAERMRDMRQDLWKNEVKPKIDAHANEDMWAGASPMQPGTATTNPVADAIRARITPAMTKISPKSAKAIETFAKRFEGPMKLGESEELVEHLNAELADQGYWKKSASERAAADKANPIQTARSAAAEAIRDAQGKYLESVGEKDIPELKRTYGAMRNVENEVRGQVNVASRQNPISLKQIIALASGHPLGIAATLADKIYNEPAAILNRAVSKNIPDSATATISKVATKAGGAVKAALPAAGAVAGEWIQIQGSDGKKYEVHPEDLAEAKKRDPKLEVIQ